MTVFDTLTEKPFSNNYKFILNFSFDENQNRLFGTNKVQNEIYQPLMVFGNYFVFCYFATYDSFRHPYDSFWHPITMIF